MGHQAGEPQLAPRPLLLACVPGPPPAPEIWEGQEAGQGMPGCPCPRQGMLHQPKLSQQSSLAGSPKSPVQGPNFMTASRQRETKQFKELCGA